MKKNALICEDSMTTAYCLKTMFKKLNYSSDIAPTAQKALDLLHKKKYDVMTLDLILPDKHGFELLKDIKKDNELKNIPIIIITSLKKNGIEITKDVESIPWLEKTCDQKDFEIALSNLLSKPKKKKAIEILHVENDEDLLTLIEITLGDISNVTKVSNLKRAKEIIEKKQFDIIILDYVFPDGTSDKLIPSIKNGPCKNSKLIMFSAYEENKILAKYVDQILIKTNVSYEDFKKCIETIIQDYNDEEVESA